jgi:hypothetical protein
MSFPRRVITHHGGPSAQTNAEPKGEVGALVSSVHHRGLSSYAVMQQSFSPSNVVLLDLKSHMDSASRYPLVNDDNDTHDNS